MTAAQKLDWQKICRLQDLVPDSGVCALSGKQQIAIFYLPDEARAVYAIQNHDPISGANVLARGIIGDVDGEIVVASPIYKQHFCLSTGKCLEQSDIQVRAYETKVDGEDILIRI